MDDAWNFKVAFPFDSVFLRLDSVPSGSSRSLSISMGLFIPMAWNFNSLQLRETSSHGSGPQASIALRVLFAQLSY